MARELHPFRRYRGDTRPTDDALDDRTRYRSDFRRWKRYDTSAEPPPNADAESFYGEWKPPYGSVDAGYFLRGGRYLGCGVTLLMLIFPAVIFLYGIRALMLQAINYELLWLPLSTLQCATALAIFAFAPLLPFRLWMLFTAINKDNEDTQQEKPLPTRAQYQADEWNGWGKEETRDYLKSRENGDGAGYLVMAGLFMESAAMKRLVPSLSRLKYSLSDDELKDFYYQEKKRKELQQSGDVDQLNTFDQRMQKLEKTREVSPLDLVLVVEESEEGAIQGKIDKAQGRKKDEEKKKPPQSVQWIFWFATAAIRLVGYILMPIVVLKWLSNLMSRSQFGDHEEYSRSRDNGTHSDAPPSPRPLPMTTHQAGVLEILKLPPEKRDRFAIVRVPQGRYDQFLGKSEPQTKPRALNFGIYHKFKAANHAAVRFKKVQWEEQLLGYLIGFLNYIIEQDKLGKDEKEEHQGNCVTSENDAAEQNSPDHNPQDELSRALGFNGPKALYELNQLRRVFRNSKPDSDGHVHIVYGKYDRIYASSQIEAIKNELEKQIVSSELGLLRIVEGLRDVEEFQTLKSVIEAAFGTPIFSLRIDPDKESSPQEKLQVVRRFYETDFAGKIWLLLLDELRAGKPVPIWRDFELDPSKTRYSVVYDAEDRPEEDQLLKAVREYEADRALLNQLRVKSILAIIEMMFAPRSQQNSSSPYRLVHGASFERGVEKLKVRLLGAHAIDCLEPLRTIQAEHEELRRLVEDNKQGVELQWYTPFYTDDTHCSGQQNQENKDNPEFLLDCFLRRFERRYRTSGEYAPELRAMLKKFDLLMNNPRLVDELEERLYSLLRWIARMHPNRAIRRKIIRHFFKLERQYRQLEAIIAKLEYKTVCFQAKLTYENLDDNWVISLFKADYASWFNYLLPGLHKNQMAIPLGGTSNHFKVDFLRYVGGWDAYNVAEDCDLGMWIARHDKQVRVLNSITWEVASSNIVNWVGQRSRWIKGYAQSYFVHMRRPLLLLRDLGWRRFWGFQFTVGAGFLMPMLSPFFYVMTGIYLISLTAIIITGFTTSETTLEFAKIPLRYIYDIHYYWILPFGTGSFFIANIIYFLILVIGQLRHPKPGNMRWVVTWWWLYWLFMNAAAFRALWEYIFDPYSWDKSDHSYL